MSSIKDTIESVDKKSIDKNGDTPLKKFLRGFIYVVLIVAGIVVICLAYSLISGKPINWASKLYRIGTTDTMKNLNNSKNSNRSNTLKNDSIKKGEKTTIKSETKGVISKPPHNNSFEIPNLIYQGEKLRNSINNTHRLYGPAFSSWVSKCWGYLEPNYRKEYLHFKIQIHQNILIR